MFWNLLRCRQPNCSWAGQALDVWDEDGGQGHEDGGCDAHHRLEHLRPHKVVGQLVDGGEDDGRQDGVQQHWAHLND